MTNEERKAEEARLQAMKDDGLIHGFIVREKDVAVTLLAPVGQFKAERSLTGSIVALTYGKQ